MEVLELDATWEDKSPAGERVKALTLFSICRKIVVNSWLLFALVFFLTRREETRRTRTERRKKKESSKAAAAPSKLVSNGKGNESESENENKRKGRELEQQQRGRPVNKTKTSLSYTSLRSSVRKIRLSFISRICGSSSVRPLQRKKTNLG